MDKQGQFYKNDKDQMQNSFKIKKICKFKIKIKIWQLLGVAGRQLAAGWRWLGSILDSCRHK
jgi:hypothetical protein